MPKASVKIMLSYDYNHFEISLGNDLEMTLAEADSLRKDAQRLADKAVEQYKTAKRLAGQKANIMSEKHLLEREIEKIKTKPESEWTATDKAKVKALQDHDYWTQYDYDYDDEPLDY